MVINSFLKSLKEDNTKFANELIIAGSYGWMEEELISKLRAGYYGQKIKFIENPDDSVIEELYKSANFVISASEAEGFGLPPLEGMLFGCLPIVSNLPQHHENMGNKAIYFDLSENSLLDAISTSKKIPQTVRRKLALDAHNYVRNEFSHEALIIKWKKLLA
jgi:alpha-1,2-rhamnosyltransferase